MSDASDTRERLKWGRRERGELIAERYRLDDILGSGGMGTVFLGHHMELQTPVALKLLKPALGQRELFAQRFRREARVAARLRHPNAVQIHDFGHHDEQAYIVMELVDGEPLSEIIRHRQRDLNLARCLRIGRVLADVLAAAHAMSMIHRDLKPDNIIVDLQGDEKEWVTVIDFGLAFVNEDREPELSPEEEDLAALVAEQDDDVEAGIKTLFEIGRLTEAGRTAGTPRYVSPEQARGAALTGAADVYSFGCVLYELLVARPPFVGRTAPDIVNQHLFVAPRPPSRDAPEIPAWLDELIMEMLDKRPHARPTAVEIMQRLDEHLQGGRGDGARGSYRLPDRNERIGNPAALAGVDTAPPINTLERVVTIGSREITDALVIAFRINGLAPEPLDELCEDGVAPDAVAVLLGQPSAAAVARLKARGVVVLCEEDPKDFPALTRHLRAGATEVLPLHATAAELARAVSRGLDTQRRRAQRR